MIHFTDRNLRVAIAVSGAVHLLGLSAFAAWSAFSVSRAEFAGERLIVQFTTIVPIRVPEPPQVKFFLPTSEPTPPQPAQLVLVPKKTAMKQRETAPRVSTVEDLRLVKETAEIGQRHRDTSELNELDQTLAAFLPKAHPADPELDTTAEVLIEKQIPVERPPAVRQKPSTVGVSEKTPPDLSRNIPPPYPSVAVQRGWEGTVILRVSIDERGVVTSAAVETGSGYEILDQSAVSSVRRWKGKPAYQRGKPIATVEFLPVRFKLR